MTYIEAICSSFNHYSEDILMFDAYMSQSDGLVYVSQHVEAWGCFY